MKRRQLLKLSSALGLIPLINISAIQANEGEVSEEEPLAKGLNYVKEADKASDHPKYVKGNICENCMFFKTENNGCALFGNRKVERKGWCLSWAPQPSATKRSAGQ